MDNPSNHQKDGHDRYNVQVPRTWYNSIHPSREKTQEEISAELSYRFRRRERNNHDPSSQDKKEGAYNNSTANAFVVQEAPPTKTEGTYYSFSITLYRKLAQYIRCETSMFSRTV